MIGETEEGWGSIWELSGLSTQLFYKVKTTLKIKSIKKWKCLWI